MNSITPEFNIYTRLESIKELPTIPIVVSEVLNLVDNPDVSAGKLASLIVKDQSLTARVLAVANSPFYGFQRKISTIELAIVVLGSNALKEILLSLIIRNFFSRIRKDILDIESFWKYSLFCGAAARVLARKLGYKKTGEAFVAGLMHDIGILAEVQYFSKRYAQVKDIRKSYNLSLPEAEKVVLNACHAEIGAWISSRWNLPENLGNAILLHHTSYQHLESETENVNLLTAIISMSEWFAADMGFKSWAEETVLPELYLAEEILEDLKEHELYNPESALNLLKLEIIDEFEKTSVFGQLSNH